MKQTTRATLILLLCGLIDTAFASGTIEVTTGEYAPWSSETLKHKGFTSHVISEAFKLEGYEVSFTFFPWKRAYQAARKGDRFHATSYWYHSDERVKEFFYSEPIQVDRYVFFYRKDAPIGEWQKLEDLRGVSMGATSGYTYTAEFWAAGKSGLLTISEANSDELNFKKLLRGRIDAFPVGPLVGQKLLKAKFSQEQIDSLAIHPKPLMAVDGHLLFPRNSAKSEALLASFNRALKKLRESGRYQEMEAALIAGEYER